MKIIKIGSYLLLFCLFLSFSCFVSAQSVYTITEQELTILESNNKIALQEAKILKEELAKAKSLTMKQEQLLKEASQEQVILSSDLKRTNQLFNQYAKEEQAKLNKAKRQRDLYLITSIVLGYYMLKG